MTDSDKDTRDDLAGFFAAAKRERYDLPDGLTGRILHDARQVQDGFVADLANRPTAPGLLRSLREVLGGWPAMAGLLTVCTAGVWLGYSPPDALPDAFVISTLSQENIDMFDADGLTTGWIEYNAFTENLIVE